MKQKAKYRVQFCFGMDSLHRDFSDARCALRCYRRLAKELGGYSPPNSKDYIYVRLWNRTLERVLMSTEARVQYHVRDEELEQALISEIKEEPAP